MQFIERVFGISLDGGSGVIEFCLFVLPLVVVVFGAWRRSTRKRSAGSA